MNKQIELGLEGAFKVDLFNGQGQMVSTTDYFSNFITPTGLAYPYVYAFADCFRYLSIGRSATANSGTTTLNNLGVTGLFDPINSYQVSNGTSQVSNYIDWRAYATGGETATCGTVVTEQGPRFYRAWNIPSGNGLVMNEPTADGLAISEFMVSPSSGTDPTGKYAFSRVVRNLFIPNGHRAVVSYQLRINIRNTGVTMFSGGTFRTGNAEIENDVQLVSGWANLSGYYRQVYHGLRCVDQIGMTYTPKLGDAMEPSSQNTNKMVWYLSPDNGQFDVNENGSNQTSVPDAYRSAGLLSYLRTLDLRGLTAYSSEVSAAKGNLTSLYHRSNPPVVSTIPSTTVPQNARIGNNSTALQAPVIHNYFVADTSAYTYQTSQPLNSRSVSYATPGWRKYSTFYSDFGRQAVFSSFTDNIPFQATGQNLITGRKKVLTRKSIFSPINSLGYNTRFGSMVFAYNGSTAALPSRTYYPLIDVLFFDTSGRSLMQHFRWGSGLHLFESGTGIVDATIFFSTAALGSGYLGHSGCKTTQSGHNPFYGGADINGKISLSINNTTIQYNGWGGITGFLRGVAAQGLTGFTALTDHNISDLNEPNATGDLYWPYVHPSNKITMGFSGVTYYHPKLSGLLVDTGAWFGPNRQIVRNIYFPTGSTSPYSETITGARPAPTILTVGGSGFVHSGYFLTTRRFTNVISAVGANATNNSESGVLTGNQFITGSVGFALTGYVIPGYIIPGKLNGTVWQDAGLIPSLGIPFTVQTTTVDLTIRSGEGGSVPAVSGRSLTTITGLFSGLQNLIERGYLIGTGGTPIKANESLYVFFTGFSGSNPIYVTRVSRNEYTSSSNTVRDLYIDSTFTGIAETTDFCYPSGRLKHAEFVNAENGTLRTGYRLLPSFAEANFVSTSTGATVGGEYPALSMDNGLEVFLDISWSSPCGSNTQGGTCYEPI
jgi:hypothetical protein